MKKTVVLILLLSVTLASFACRYTVREIGFADFGQDEYRFVLFKDGRISDAEAKTFINTARAAMLDANIIVQVIDVENDTSSIIKYYNEYEGSEKPNIILISPEKRAKAFFIDRTGNFSLAIWDLIEDVLISPARKELTDNIIKAYGVILFIEGTNQKENEQARATLNKGIVEIKQIMGGLPHPVNTPPHIITIKPEETERESVMLWSLGWEKKDAAHPAMAMMYGRARRMGPMLKGDRIRQDIIENMLRYIGEDCECGLDKSWMLGTMLPLRWDSKLMAAVVKHHGFDAENPMVVSEMSQIISVAPQKTSDAGKPNLLYGYSENRVKVGDKKDVNSNEKSLTKETKASAKKSISKKSQTKVLTQSPLSEKSDKIDSSDKTDEDTAAVVLPKKPVMTFEVVDEPEKAEPAEPEWITAKSVMYTLALLFLLVIAVGSAMFFRKKR